MSNTKRGQVTLVLDKERTLFYDLNALVNLEELGVDISKLQDGVQMSHVRAILWAGLVHEDKELTLEDVGAFVTIDNINEVSEKLTVAFNSNGKK